MKKLPLILSSISLVGVIAIFVLFMTGHGGRKKASGSESAGGSSELKIAYLQTDSILLNYSLAIDLNEDFVGKHKQYTAEFGQKRSSLEQQAIAFQEKVQRGGFLTQERAMKERDRLLAQEEDMKRMDYELSTKLSEMEADIQKQLVDSIVSYVKEYNKIHNYTYILSNAGNIIVGDQQYNITKDIVDGLNARYAVSKKR
jgi:outer membrane protein